MIKRKKTYPVLLVLTLAVAFVAMAISAVQLDGKQELRDQLKAEILAQRASISVSATQATEEQPVLKSGQADRPSISVMAPDYEEYRAALEAKADEQAALEAKLTEEMARKDKASELVQVTASMPHVEKDIRANPFKRRSLYPAHVSTMETEILWEGFEGGVVPPAGWTAIVNNPYTWEIDSYNPYEGTYNASCFYDQDYTGTQDEWLVSPVLDLSQRTDWVLEFVWMGSYYWGVDPYDNYDLEVWISTDGGENWTTMLWTEPGTEDPWTNWTWYEATVDLSGYSAESNVKLGFRYHGYDGAQWSIDAISVNDIPLPVGRCCYGDPTAPSCADVIEEECDAMEGYSWDEGLNCTDHPCPTAPDNDECANAELIPPPFPATASGTTVGATIDCPGVLDWNAVWYKFDAPNVCNDVVISYCGNPYDIECIGIVITM